MVDNPGRKKYISEEVQNFQMRRNILQKRPFLLCGAVLPVVSFYLPTLFILLKTCIPDGSRVDRKGPHFARGVAARLDRGLAFQKMAGFTL